MIRVPLGDLNRALFPASSPNGDMLTMQLDQ
jgi:hypothetical protein